MRDRLQILKRTLACRLRYAWRSFCHLLGYCHKCGEPVNRTRSGACLCPSCGAR